MSSSPPFKINYRQGGFLVRGFVAGLTEVGKRILELVNELYEVGIHDLPS